MKPKVSVIVPVYNNETYLKVCIESLINQTLKELEILLLDDGSTDSSGDICDEYARKDTRIRVIHKENEGLGITRNVGLAAAQGEYFAFLDSDDYVDTDMYEFMYRKIRDENADFCIGGSYRVFDDGSIEKNLLSTEEGVYEKKQIRECILPRIIGSAPSDKEESVLGYSMNLGLYALRIVRENNLAFYSEREFIEEDVLFKIQYYCFAKKMVLLQRPFYYYRYQRNSLSNVYKKDRFDKITISYKKEFEILEKSDIKDGICYATRMYLADMRSCMRQVLEMESVYFAYKEFRRMVDHPFTQCIIGEYPYRLNPLPKRVFAWCVDKRHCFLLMLLLCADFMR